jgi:hypothetical protein
MAQVDGPEDITGLVLVNLEAEAFDEALEELIEICVENINSYSNWEENYSWMSDDACQAKLVGWQVMLASLNWIKRQTKKGE